MIGGLAAFLLSISVLGIMKRVASGINTVVLFSVIASITVLAIILTGMAVMAEFMEILAVVILFSALSELFVFLFTFVSSSVSANILLRLLRTDGIATTEFDRVYSPRAMIERRVEQLQLTGLATLVDGHLRPTARGWILSAVARAFRRLHRFE